jgi:hypothetical protein
MTKTRKRKETGQENVERKRKEKGQDAINNGKSPS